MVNLLCHFGKKKEENIVIPHIAGVQLRNDI